MNPTDPRGPFADLNYCRLKDLGLRRLKPRTLLLLCLDAAHGSRILKYTNAGLFVSSCPLQVRQYLDEHPRQQVIMDRCRASLRCCRRPLGDLQHRIQGEVHRERGPIGLSNAPESTQSSHSGPISIDRVKEVCQRIGESSNQEIRLRDLADVFAVCPRQLNRLFHATMGLAPMQAVRRQRLLATFKQIRACSRSIEAIAEDLHYCDRSSFSRGFRRAFGFNPGMLKKRSSSII